MKHLFYLFLLIVFLLLAGCEDKKETKQVQNISTHPPKPKPIQEYHFDFFNTKKENLHLLVKNNHYKFSTIKEPIVLVNFFATWCPPCRGLMPHLNNLQKKYAKELAILGILIHDKISNKQINICTSVNKIKYFISSNLKANKKFADFISPKLKLPAKFNLPLIIMFVEGKYYTHYEGIAPEEMIESDIKQALNKIKGL